MHVLLLMHAHYRVCKYIEVVLRRHSRPKYMLKVIKIEKVQQSHLYRAVLLWESLTVETQVTINGKD